MKEEILKLIQETAEEIAQIDAQTVEENKALTAYEDSIEEMAPELQATKQAFDEAEAVYLKAREDWEKIYGQYYDLDNNRLDKLSQIGILQRRKDDLETKKADLLQQLADLENDTVEPDAPVLPIPDETTTETTTEEK